MMIMDFPENHRCSWISDSQNTEYLKYHDEEWGVPLHEDRRLFEALILECFQSGLSFELILKKREAFRQAFDHFDYHQIQNYDEKKIEALLQNREIIRSRGKIEATIQNARVFVAIQKEWGSFSEYLWHFTDFQTIVERGKTASPLSDEISKDLKKRGMKYIGSQTIYAFLQAVGVINSHEEGCFLCQRKEKKASLFK